MFHIKLSDNRNYILKAAFVLGLFFLSAANMSAQDIKVIDSLEPIYLKGEFKEIDRLEILYKLCFNHPDPQKSIEYGKELIQYAEERNEIEYMITGYNQIAQGLTGLGNHTEAFEYLMRAANLAEQNKLENRLASTYLILAGLFQATENFSKAEEYYFKGLKIEESKDSTIAENAKRLALAQLNYGWNFYLQDKLDSARIYYEKGLKNAIAADFDQGQLYYNLDMGLLYSKQGNDEKASEMITEALNIAMVKGNFKAVCEVLQDMAQIYKDRGEFEEAQYFLLQDLELADKYNYKMEISNAHQMLADISLSIGDTIRAYKHFQNHIAYKDSIVDLEKVKEMANLQSAFEVSQKQNEVNLLNQQRKNQNIITIATGIGLFLVALLALGLFRRYRFIKRVNEIIEVEKNRSDLLLMNILPEETAQELKDSGKVEAKKFESVTVLFADFQGFTLHSEDLSPEKLVRSVDYYFSEFDKIISRYGLEKIKTIGDAYMCAGGLPFPTEDHPLKMTKAAFEMMNFMEQAKIMDDPQISNFEVRIGINTGPVVAGVVGKTKFAYDIWGDTVNVAARMEQNSSPGHINVSENTYQFIKETFDCKYRGKVDVKNKGMMSMYYVHGYKKKSKKSEKLERPATKPRDADVSASKFSDA